MKKSLIALAFAMTSSTNIFAADIGNSSANVSMDVGLYASVTGLDDMVMAPDNGKSSGEAGAMYAADDTFHLESNGQVNMTVSISQFEHSGSAASIEVWTELDGGTASPTDKITTTASDSTHDSDHHVRLHRYGGNISDHAAGTYTGSLTVTVAGL